MTDMFDHIYGTEDDYFICDGECGATLHLAVDAFGIIDPVCWSETCSRSGQHRRQITRDEFIAMQE